MPIRVLDNLPAVKLLRKENIFVMTKSRANKQEIRPIKVVILNLMPKKIETENQFLRLLSNSPLQVDIQLLRIDNRISKNTPTEHLNSFYCSFTDIKSQNFDGLIVTGAPLGLIDFCDISFWSKFKKILLWSKEHVMSTLFICWAVQGALNIYYNIPKMTNTKKLVGVFLHHTLCSSALLTRGFDEYFLAPHSRHAAFPVHIIKQYTDLEILASSDEVGAYLFVSKDKRLVFVTGHPEYDAVTLSEEYHRDLNNGLSPTLPVNYYPMNNPKNTPKISWRSHGYLLFANWLNYYVYQITPYDLYNVSFSVV